MYVKVPCNLEAVDCGGCTARYVVVQFIVESQIKLHGFDVADALVEVPPRAGEFTHRTEDILAAIAEHGSSVALVLFSGVQYFTGQVYDVRVARRTAALGV